MDADPSIDAIDAPFTAAMHHYLRGELGSSQDLPYEVFANAIKQWSLTEFEGKPINVADKLERLMRVNPHLRVRIEYGYYDLATPYHAAEDMVAHLRLPEDGLRPHRARVLPHRPHALPPRGVPGAPRPRASRRFVSAHRWLRSRHSVVEARAGRTARTRPQPRSANGRGRGRTGRWCRRTSGRRPRG